jgi:hypothetical protein
VPTPELMTWVPSQRRWTIRYRGRRYYVSCRQLGIRPETKEASIQAANQWWRDKQSSIDLALREEIAAQHRQPRPFEDIGKTMLASNADWPTALLAFLRGWVSSQPPIEPMLADLPTNVSEDAAAAVLRQAMLALLEKAVIDGEPLPDYLKRLANARYAQIDRGVKELRGEQAAEPDRTVKALGDAWLASLETQVTINVLTPASYDRLRKMFVHAVAFFGEPADISSINAEQMEAFYHYCLSRIADNKWTRLYAKMIFTVAKQWVGWLAERGTIPYPANFRRQWRFGSTLKQVEIWPTEDVRRIIDAATGKLRLCLLLMLNCGMTQKDVSDLLDMEVNWRDGRIVRKRSKTRGHVSAPTVDYKLWPETFDLLKDCRSGFERVLLTKSGGPYVHKRMVDGKLREYDGFGTMLRRLTKKLGIKRPIKQLRKTSASLLESHEVYGRYASYFLGHAPRSMADKHYVKPSQDLFDKAVAWLGEQYGK